MKNQGIVDTNRSSQLQRILSMKLGVVDESINATIKEGFLVFANKIVEESLVLIGMEKYRERLDIGLRGLDLVCARKLWSL